MSDFDRMVFLPEGSLLDYYRGVFDAVFMAVHPFYRVPNLSPLDCDYRPQVFVRSEMPDDVDLIAYGDKAAEQSARLHPIDEVESNRRAKQAGRQVSWSDVAAGAGLADARAIDRSLRTSIYALGRIAEETGADRLCAWCASENIFLPTEGVFQPLLEDSLVALFRSAGFDRVLLCDEFGDDEVAVPLDVLAGRSPWQLDPALPDGFLPRRLRAIDDSVLAVVPWDDFQTVIAMTAERAAAIRPDTLFEGFWCRNDTTTAWFTGAPVKIGVPGSDHA